MATKKGNCEGCEEQEGSGGSILDRIWDEQRKFRELWINGPVNDSLIYKIVTQIQNFNAYDDEVEASVSGQYHGSYERDEIKLFINTNGGDLTAAFSIISAIKASRTPVVTVAMGKAYSAGFLILLAGDLRYAQEYSDLMYHQLSAYYGAFETVKDVQERAEQLQREHDKAERFVLEQTDLTDDHLGDAYFGKKDWYITPAEAIEHGVIHGIWRGKVEWPEYQECEPLISEDLDYMTMDDLKEFTMGRNVTITD